MTLTCPHCGSAISLDDTNIATDIALCRACERATLFSEITGNFPPVQALEAPPQGAWFRETLDGFTAGATTRSYQAFFLIPFTCVWSGMSLHGIYGSQITKGSFEIGSSLFGLPFLIGSVALVTMCVMHIAGQVKVTRRGEAITIFEGVGPLGWTRSYVWDDFQFANESRGGGRGQQNYLTLEGVKRVRFGSLLRDDRRFFLLNVLRHELRAKNGLRNRRPAS